MNSIQKAPERPYYVALLGFILACLAIGGLGGWVTAGSVATWFPTLNKPPFNPPAWLFGPVWTTLYVMMGVAAWRVWRKAGWGTPLNLFAAQLALNCAWSFLFFGLQSPGLALLDIVPLLVLILLTIRAFWPIDRIAGGLLVPYAAWVSFATLLNASIWWLNR
jgi:tryptophan-rich sensory protein